MGRRDEQFKINGVRLDPQEIVVAMQKSCQLKDVHVMQINGEIVAFVYGKINSEAETKSSLMKVLPRYMIPNRIIQLADGIPLNQNGKIDQQLLREGYSNMITISQKTEHKSIVGENAQKLAEIWAETISYSPSSNSNFFEAGGHSLLVIKLQAKIKEVFGIELSFDQLYRFSNFDDQLALIEERISTQYDIIQVIRETPNATCGLYCIHAIGTTIYPYYSLVSVWPVNCNIYAIAYQSSYPANNLNQLAEFYYNQVRVI
jgi:acyl carrier protein